MSMSKTYDTLEEWKAAFTHHCAIKPKKMEEQTLHLTPELDKSIMTFHLTEDGEQKEIIKITKEGFYYKGEKVEDAHNVYEKFNEWLTKAEYK
jgi:hypothetical protein